MKEESHEWLTVVVRKRETWSRTTTSILEWRPSGYESADPKDYHRCIGFLLGKLVGGAVIHISQSVRPSDLGLEFLLQLFQLGTIPRTTSQVKDYVLSVWVDLAAYQIPENFKNMGLRELLDDAMTQLERLGNQTPPDSLRVHKPLRITYCVSLPAGLFGAKAGTAAWRPAYYIDDQLIQSSE